MTEGATFGVRLAAAILVAAAAASAATFTAVRRTSTYHLDAYDPQDTLTLDVPEGGDAAAITVPTDIFSRYAHWPPPAALLFNGAEARNADCDSPHIIEKIGVCEGLLAVRHGGDGRSTIVASRQTVAAAVEHLYLIQKRYDTCVRTGGAVDILHENRRCPPVTEVGGFDRVDGPHSLTGVVKPWSAMILRIAADYSHILGEHHFLVDTPALRREHATSLPEDARPLDSHYGELNRLMAWYEYAASGGPAAEAGGMTTVVYDAGSAAGILDALSVLTNALSPRIEAGGGQGNSSVRSRTRGASGAGQENPYVRSIRWNIEQLKLRTDLWR